MGSLSPRKEDQAGVMEMKKTKTNSQNVQEKKPRRTRKEKTDVSIRLDRELVSRVYAQIKEEHEAAGNVGSLGRITDAIESGLRLWLKRSTRRRRRKASEAL